MSAHSLCLVENVVLGDKLFFQSVVKCVTHTTYLLFFRFNAINKHVNPIPKQ